MRVLSAVFLLLVFVGCGVSEEERATEIAVLKEKILRAKELDIIILDDRLLLFVENVDRDNETVYYLFPIRIPMNAETLVIMIRQPVQNLAIAAREVILQMEDHERWTEVFESSFVGGESIDGLNSFSRPEPRDSSGSHI